MPWRWVQASAHTLRCGLRASRLRCSIIVDILVSTLLFLHCCFYTAVSTLLFLHWRGRVDAVSGGGRGGRP